MKYTVFPPGYNNTLNEPMFLGSHVNVARYDRQKYQYFEQLTEKQISFFWRPEEVDVSKDRIDFKKLNEAEKHIFMSNLKYQTLLDSIQGRSPNVALLPLCSLPELETWIETWSFFETIHSRSYTHILRGVLNDPTAEFDDIADNPEIQKRAAPVTKYYDELIDYTQKYNQYGEGTHVVNGETVVVSKRELKKRLYLTLIAVNVLEGIRFYVSFACTFAFVERDLMDGNGKIVKLIARDENLHMQGVQYKLNLYRKGKDDPEMTEIAKECEAEATEIYLAAVKQEKEWAEYLFSKGSFMGLNAEILSQYVEFITDRRMEDIGLKAPFNTDAKHNPLPWMANHLNSDNRQVAPQESEIDSYLVGQVDIEINQDELKDINL